MRGAAGGRRPERSRAIAAMPAPAPPPLPGAAGATRAAGGGGRSLQRGRQLIGRRLGPLLTSLRGRQGRRAFVSAIMLQTF